MRLNKTLNPSALLLAIGMISLMGVSSVHAAQPESWQLGFQPAATDMMARISSFNDFLLILMTAITVFVLGLMVYVMLRFNAKANPVPSKTSHNTLIEVVWTVIPILILLVIAVPSFRLLYDQATPEADMTIKATGYQWYWGYEYPDHGDIAFDALMLEDDELQPGQPRLLTTDNAVVVPVDTTVRVLVTAADVIHNWAMPAFGVKMDAYPGRLNETWFRANKTGTYYGQCSELCGIRHSFMPIMVKVVEKEEFTAWVEQAKVEFASYDEANTNLAEVSATHLSK
ncbi:MAG: cytochrome c oxidase subunit II [Pseudomonadota bacterium]|nr:cytochrome c oxidase subunit II [Pseudomonadota bacterium]